MTPLNNKKKRAVCDQILLAEAPEPTLGPGLWHGTAVADLDLLRPCKSCSLQATPDT